MIPFILSLLTAISPKYFNTFYFSRFFICCMRNKWEFGKYCGRVFSRSFSHHFFCTCCSLAHKDHLRRHIVLCCSCSQRYFAFVASLKYLTSRKSFNLSLSRSIQCWGSFSNIKYFAIILSLKYVTTMLQSNSFSLTGTHSQTTNDDSIKYVTQRF